MMVGEVGGSRVNKQRAYGGCCCYHVNSQHAYPRGRIRHVHVGHVHVYMCDTCRRIKSKRVEGLHAFAV